MAGDRTARLRRGIMRPVHSYLRGSPRPLAEVYDVALLDLDGVVYIGPHAVAGAPEALSAARAAGMHLAFVTNNAARPVGVVAGHLTDLGIQATATEVITSAQAAARYLAERLSAGSRVLVVGTTGLVEALQEQGLVPVADAVGHVDAVVQGYSPDLNWHQLAEGAVAINRGVPWVATNVDPTVPSPRGPLPGNGSLVAALRHATGAEPIVTGKPDPTMHRETLLRTGAQRPIVVGDRLDTDIEGANAVGCDSLLVLSGVTSPRELLAASMLHRPTFISSDLGGLLVAHSEAPESDDGAVCGAWRVLRVDDPGSSRRLRLERLNGNATSSTSADGDLDALRALCVAAWADDAAGPPTVEASGDDPAGRRAADEVIDRWSLR
jgi:glycerol 3-phosphatase-2